MGKYDALFEDSASTVKPAGKYAALFEEAPAQAPQEAQPGPIMRGLDWVSTQLDRGPAAARGAIQAFQEGDPRTQARNPAYMAYKGFTDPKSVQTFGHMYQNMGVPNDQTTRMKQVNGHWVPGIPDNERPQDGRNPDGSIKYKGPDQGKNMGLADGLGLLTEAVAPTGLEAIPLAGVAAKVLRSDKLMKPLEMAANLPNKALGKAAQELSSVSEEALRLSGSKEGRKALQANSGKEYEIGQRIVQMMDNPKEYAPNKILVDNALKGMGNVDIAPVVKALQEAKIRRPSGKIFKHEEAANAAIQADINALLGTNGRTAIPADEVVDLRRAMDEVIDHTGDQKQLAIVNDAKLKGRKVMRDILEQKAVETGNPEYVQGMASLHKQLDARDRLSRFLGKNKEAREDRAESFIANMWGKNKKNRQRVMADIGEAFGKDFVDESKLANLAAQLGEEGKAGFFSRSSTGRSKLGGMFSFPLSSPMVASRVTLPLANLPSKAVQTLRSLAGAKSAGESAYYVGQLKSLGMDDGAIQNGIKSMESPKTPPAAPAAAVQSPPPSNPPQGPAAKRILEFSPQQNVQRRHAAIRYLTETTKDAPTQGEIYKFLADIGEKEVPKPPVKPKIEREFNGRRDARTLEFLDHAIRGGVSDINTKPMTASEAPKTFTLQGTKFQRVRKDNRVVVYKDEQGRKHEFDPKDTIHMDYEKDEVPF